MLKKEKSSFEQMKKKLQKKNQTQISFFTSKNRFSLNCNFLFFRFSFQLFFFSTQMAAPIDLNVKHVKHLKEWEEPPEKEGQLFVYHPRRSIPSKRWAVLSNGTLFFFGSENSGSPISKQKVVLNIQLKDINEKIQL